MKIDKTQQNINWLFPVTKMKRLIGLVNEANKRSKSIEFDRIGLRSWCVKKCVRNWNLTLQPNGIWERELYLEIGARIETIQITALL